MRSRFFLPNFLVSSLSIALLAGCAHPPGVNQNSSYQEQQDQMSTLLMAKAADAYLSSGFGSWDVFRTRQVVQEQKKVEVVRSANIDSTLKASALAGTLQAALEVEPKVAINIAPLIEQSAEKHPVPAALIAAVVNAESEFRSGRRSGAGAVGLMQIMPRVWGKQCNLKTDAGNIDCGAKILAHYFELSGSWDKALAFYNVGPGRYEKSRGARMTGHRYASHVLASMKQIKAGREEQLLASAQGL